MKSGQHESLEGIPLSYGQQALWLLHKCMPGTGIYNLHWVWSIPDHVDIGTLKEALKILVHKHPSLMSLYRDNDGECVQYVPKEKPFIFEEYSIDEMTDQEFINTHLDEQVHREFDLENNPPARWIVFHRENTKRVVGFFFQHLSTDLWSVMIFVNELRGLYSALKEGRNVVLSDSGKNYNDFIRWQNEFVSSPEGEEQKAYWLKELDGLNATLNLPLDYVRPSSMSCNGGVYTSVLDKSIISDFYTQAARIDVSPFSMYMAAYHLFLHKYCGQNDIVVGTPTAGRGKDFSGIYGYFVNPIVICSNIDSSKTIEDFTKSLSEKISKSIEYGQYPLSLISEKLLINRSDSQSQLFQATFVWENINRFENRDDPLVKVDRSCIHKWNMEDMGVWERLPIDQQVDSFDVSFKFYKFKDDVTFSIEFNRDIFKESTISRMAKHFGSVMRYMIDAPSQKISDISLLTKDEIVKVSEKWNDTEFPYRDDESFSEIFSKVSKRFPENEAINFEGSITTYKELEEKSNRLAHYLIDLGVVSEMVVGISLERSLEMIVTLLAILKSGGAYLPLDPDYPKDRLQYMIEDAGLSFIVTTKNVKENIPTTNASLLCLDELKSTLSEQAVTTPKIDINKDSLAYLLYTSGSTGKPKGVMIEHKALSNFVASHRRVFKVSEHDRVLLFSSLNFDTSIFAISLALQFGATLYFARKELLVGDGLISYLSDNEITWALLPPPVASALQPKKLEKLKTLVFGGEACSQELVKIWSKGRDLFNGYGPTETTVWATVAKVGGDSAPPIGKPVANTQCYVLDKHLNQQPIGVPGELHVGGDSLARGYLNRQDLTDEKFISNPFSDKDGARLYKTGDLVRYLEDGSIDFLGRIDHQIKIRGFRVELGEIESILREHISVEDVLVVACNDKREASEDKYLAAYVVRKPGEDTNVDILRCYLKEILPDYMVPSAFVLLDAFPLTVNKKIDRKKLPFPTINGKSGSEKYIPPRNEIERIISDVWLSLLPVSKVSIFENFFDLGGHSLLLAKVFGKLPEMLKNKLTMVDLFKYPTIQALSHYLENDEEDETFYLHQDQHFERLRLRRRSMEALVGMKLAIVGMAGRFPGADTVDEFWDNIANKKESITFYSKEELNEAGVSDVLLNNPRYVRAKSAISDVKGFDASFFGFSNREAQITDPQQRLFLECSWEALEDANFVPDNEKGRTGVYAGVGINNYMMNNLSGHPELIQAVGDYPLMIGNDKDYLASRIAYKLNLDGPAVVVQTACSTSLVAVHTACQALLNQECDTALAGGVSLGRLEKSGYLYQPGMIMSPDGHCRAFDAKAEGTVQGQGAGVVVIKRLDDALVNNDHIYAVIKGTAINNDGSNKPGYTSPAVEGQAKVVLSAIASADMSPDDISYIETHGTGTPMGDPIEIEGLSEAFRTEALQRDPCAIGSVKTNIGHLDAASGVVGLIKVAKAMEQEKLPPTLHYQKNNPKINFEKTPFYVNTELKDWSADGIRYAGVSSFGIGGTNAHVVLRESPNQSPSEKARAWRMVVLSAKTPAALEAVTQRLLHYLKTTKNINFSNVCYSLQVGRKRFDYRRYLVCRNEDEAIAELEKPHHKDVVTTTYKAIPQKIVFMFSGQGSQYLNMAGQLYKGEVGFRKEVKRCRNILKDRFVYLYENLDVLDFSAQTDRLHQTYITQPSLFILEYSLAKTLMAWGIKPDIMIGHSIGEYVAACLAGVFSLEQALELVAIRGKLIQNLPEGNMLSVQLPEAEAKRYLSDDISLAAINGDSRCVYSGDSKAIIELQHTLNEDGVQNRLLHTSHAFHSHMMEPALEKFRNSVGRRNPQKPKIPFISGVTGKYITDEQATSADYWAQHLRKEVRFNDGLHTLLDREGEFESSADQRFILLEVGPSKVLTTLAKQHAKKQSQDLVIATMRHAFEEISDTRQLLKALGRLWANNVDIDWEEFHSARQRYRVPLPTYPFERKPYWVEPRPLLPFDERERTLLLADDTVDEVPGDDVPVDGPRDEIEEKVAAAWLFCLGGTAIGIYDDFFDLGGDSLIAVTLVDRLSELFDAPIASHVLIQKSTVAELSDHIKEISLHPDMAGESAMGGHASPLVLIQQGGPEKKPLFMVHPIGGEVYFYRDLGLHLGSDQPLYAFQAPGLAGNVTPLNKVKDIAKLYIDELRLTDAKPPYLLGGSSFGGLIAYEMAQQLNASGERVALIVMIDTPAPQDMPRHLTDSAAILQYLMQDKMELDLEELRRFEEKGQIDYILEKALHEDKRSALPPHLGVPLFGTWIAHQEATYSYDPVPYDGDVLFYRHTEAMPNFPSAPHKTWQPLVSGEFIVHRVQGNHITMNYPPYVSDLAADLKRRLVSERLTLDS
ncbi:hypothetical protein A9Q81_27095 [Gammaproteobacteria bacterium 42_54_T18]|nr:hypothetical protein A9Q81_27095 [Gammaproteobacteria bacterium 42_54_T18]